MKLCFLTSLAIAMIVLPQANAAPGASATNSDSPVSGDTVVARGKGFEIKRRAMDQVLATARVNNPTHPLPPDAEMRVLNQLIEIQLALQKATDAEKEKGWRQNEANFTSIKKTMGESEFNRQLKETLMTADDLRLMLFQEATAQESLTRQLGIKVTDADAKKLFDDNPGAYDQPPMARIREIVLLTTSDFTTSAAPPLPAATLQAKHQQILDLHKRVCVGEDFAALAKQFNEDPISTATSGELTFKRAQMEFGDLAFSMKPNQISDVLTNTDGYRIFQLLEIIPAKKVDFASVDDQIKRGLAGAAKRRLAPAYLVRLRKEADVQILDPGLKAQFAAADAEAAKAQAVAGASNIPPAKP